MIGTVLRIRYEVIEEIADNTIFTTVRAKDRVKGKDVTVRLLKPPFATERDILDSIRRVVDKYAKVPDWLSKNISARMAARVLNRTIAEGDARLVAQVRRLLAHTPRDFFYRPNSQ